MNKFSKSIKIISVTKLIAIYLILSFKSYADTTKAQDGLIVLGNDEAPIKIKIFSSLTCPHCANFHVNVVPKIKEKYVDTDKVQLIFIDFPLDQSAFNASKLLHCLDKKKQILFLNKIYESQNQWTSGANVGEINNNLKEIVKILGISSIKFDECINNEIISNKILEGRIDGQKKYSIDSTPTIIINEKKLEGSVSFKNIKKNIEKLI
ncbi:DsbA family protein [Pelagibacteraceae bacterium]|nr:DsbA family protein [Pelagibacteraceae bacterium]